MLLGCVCVSCSAEFHVTVGMLMQVDKLVQLLESPVFLRALCSGVCCCAVSLIVAHCAVALACFAWADLRLQLLEPERPTNANLLRSLYGLLMLLPQSRAFNTLRSRLMSTTSLHIALGSRNSCVSP